MSKYVNVAIIFSVIKELQLSDRDWVCKSCGCVIDRDYNAAKNIRDEGLRLLALIA